MRWTNIATAFTNVTNEWAQIEHNMCGHRAAWSPLRWWPCYKRTLSLRTYDWSNVSHNSGSVRRSSDETHRLYCILENATITLLPLTIGWFRFASVRVIVFLQDGGLNLILCKSREKKNKSLLLTHNGTVTVCEEKEFTGFSRDFHITRPSPPSCRKTNTRTDAKRNYTNSIRWDKNNIYRKIFHF